MQRVRMMMDYDSWNRRNCTGRGVGVAVLDTGVEEHPDLRGRIIDFQDFVHGRGYLYDDNGHGTHISGCIAGSGILSAGKYQGMAPGCHLMVLKVLDAQGNGNTSEVLEALDYILEYRKELGIRIVNISMGTISRSASDKCGQLIRAVEKAWDAGLVVVTAAGNNGPDPMTITTPGISRKVITVGALEENRGIFAQGYSGRGPTPYCVVKPEIVVPGEHIVSCGTNGKYCVKSGTSMATAIVSGAIALLLEKYPHMTNTEVKMRMYQRAVDLRQPKNQQGWGMLNLNSFL